MRFSLRQLLIGVAVIAGILTATSILLSISRYGISREVYNHVTYVTFSPDGKQLAVAFMNARNAGVRFKHYWADVSRTVALLDTATLTNSALVRHEFRKGTQGGPGPGYLYQGRRLAVFTPNAKHLHVRDWDGEEARISTWDIASRRWSQVPLVDETNVYAFALSPDGAWLAVGSGMKGITIWDTRSRQRLFSMPKESWSLTFNFSPDGKYLGLAGGKGVEIWNLRDKKLARTLHENRDVLDRVTCLELSPDGDTVAVRCGEGLRLYSISTGKEQIILPEYLEIHRDDRGWGTTERSGDSTVGVAFSPDGKLLAAWGEYGLKFFDMSEGCKVLRSAADKSIIHLAFSPDGKTYATGDGNGKVAIWDLATGKELRSTVLRANAAIQRD